MHDKRHTKNEYIFGQNSISFLSSAHEEEDDTVSLSLFYTLHANKHNMRTTKEKSIMRPKTLFCIRYDDAGDAMWIG